MSGKYGTRYTETEILFALDADDTEHAEMLVRDTLTPRERARLGDLGRDLATICRRWADAPGPAL